MLRMNALWKNWNLQVKFGVVFALVIVPLAVILVASLAGNRNTATAFVSLIDREMAIALHANNTNQFMLQCRVAENSFLRLKDIASVSRLTGFADKFREEV